VLRVRRSEPSDTEACQAIARGLPDFFTPDVIETVTSDLRAQILEALEVDGVLLVEVKTLDASTGYEPYVATRAFWERRGFVQIDTIDPLPGWQPGNPSAFYVAALAPTLIRPF
jgi:hypothetical protein